MASGADGRVIVSFGVPTGDLSREAIDGAVAELIRHEDGTVHAEVRIPAPQPQEAAMGDA